MTRPVGYADRYHYPPAPVFSRRAALLFDRVPGEPTATAFASRSDWPSTATGQQGPETLYYVTYVNDRQGYGWFDHDHYYRSARYYQVGRQER